MTPRKSLSRVRKLEILEAYNYQCSGINCHATFTWGSTNRGEVEFDHVHSLGMGGNNAADNIRPLCIPCHKKKTLTDAKARAKVKRISGQTGLAKRERARKRKLERAKRRVKMLERMQ